MTDLSRTITTADRIRAFAMSLVVGVLAAVLFLAQDGGPAEGSTYTSNENTTYLEFAGTVRNTGTWEVLNNTGHEPDDLLSVTNVTSTSIRVNHPLCAEVVSVIVGADNEYAQDFGAKFGASASFGYFVVEGSVNDGSDTGTADDIWDPTTDYSGNSNIWVFGRCIPAA
jgi:hypothetical protein